MKKLEFGTTILDMHGLSIHSTKVDKAVEQYGYRIINRIQFTLAEAQYGIFSNRIIPGLTDRYYSNKYLIVTEFTNQGTVIAMYSYDGDRVGIVELQKVSKDHCPNCTMIYYNCLCSHDG